MGKHGAMVYRIEKARSLDDLVKRVNFISLRSKHAWYPTGGVFTYTDIGNVYCQAMTRAQMSRIRKIENKIGEVE
jgi:hypothetical protein